MSSHYQQAQRITDATELSFIMGGNSLATALPSRPIEIDPYEALKELTSTGIGYLKEIMSVDDIVSYFTSIAEQGYGLIMAMSRRGRKGNEAGNGENIKGKRKQKRKGNRDQRKQREKEKRRAEKDAKQRGGGTGDSKYAKKKEDIEEWKKDARRRAQKPERRTFGHWWDPEPEPESAYERLRRRLREERGR